MSEEKKKRIPPKPFVKGDPRINRNGRPRAFDELRDIALKIVHERVRRKINGQMIEISRAEAIIRDWAKSKKLLAQEKVLIAAYGKVPDEIIINPESTIRIRVEYVRKSNGTRN